MATKPKAETAGDVIVAMDKRRADNLRIWSQLCRTDPKHTSGFKRGGGFTGTAVKPIYVTQRLTEQFGPCGDGWGFEQPQFQTVNAGDDILVYCTVTAWYLDGGKQHFLYGVGGDQVRGKNKYGFYSDDEAFKKAFTDALGNAFKFVGVAADIHMGQFDDSKYVNELRKEFAANDSNPTTGEPKPTKERVKLEGPYTSKTALWAAVRAFVHSCNGMGDLGELIGFLETKDVRDLLEQCERDAPALWSEGLPDLPEYEPLEIFIARKKRELAELETVRG